MEFAMLNPRILAAFAPFTSREETRYYLQGVLVEITTESVIYAATDGHRLAASYAPVAEPNTLLGNYIIPARVCGKWSKRLPDMARLTKEGDKTLRLKGDHDDPVIFEPIDGHFPHWRRIVPDFPDAAVEAQFNWQYLADFRELGERLNLGDARVRGNGENAAIVSFTKGGDVFGVVMPMRVQAKPRGAPSWAKLPVPEAA